MPNDLKLGTADVADVKFGTQQVSKIMKGSIEVWPAAAGGFTPTLIDSFVATAVSNSASKACLVPVGKTIPAGSLLAIGVAINGIMTSPNSMFDNSAQAGSANTYVRRSLDAWQQGTNVSGFIWLCKVTRPLVGNDQISFTHTSTRNRGAFVVAWFTDSGGFPDTTVDGSVTFQEGSSAAWSTPAQAVASANPTLDLALAFGTGGTPPYGFGSGFTEIGEITTTAGSAERGCALGYRVSPAAGNRSASGTCTSAVWGAGLIAIDYTP